MPLYTIRARMMVESSISRGAPYVEMSHHFEWADDAAAATAFPSFIGAYNNSGIEKRWTCVRGAEVHTLSLFRRNIDVQRFWDHIADLTFSLPEWEEGTQSVNIGDVPITLIVRERPLYPHDRGAVLVIEKGTTLTVSRRVYVGPISPVCFHAEIGMTLGLASFVFPSAPADFPHDPDTDRIDIWRGDIRDLARDHVHDLDAAAGAGHKVIASWSRGIWTAITETAASSVRADVRSRGRRAAMGSAR